VSDYLANLLRRPPVGWWDLLDIAVVSVLIYEFLKLIRGTRARCCARAAIGHVTVAPPTSPMNSRRFTAAPKLRTSHRNGYPTSFKQGNVPSARGLAYARIDKNNLAGRTIGSSEGVSWRQRQSWYLISCRDRRQ